MNISFVEMYIAWFMWRYVTAWSKIEVTWWMRIFHFCHKFRYNFSSLSRPLRDHMMRKVCDLAHGNPQPVVIILPGFEAVDFVKE